MSLPVDLVRHRLVVSLDRHKANTGSLIPHHSKNDIATVKIADFGLSDFYKPGAMMKTSCGSISYLAPEVFRGTSNAGPPLDVWSLGVILFAIVCGRLPFEGSDLIGTNRPRENVIRNRIMRCQYKLDDHLSPALAGKWHLLPSLIDFRGSTD